MNKLTTWFMSKFVLNGMKAKDNESLGTKNSTDFMTKYNKAIRSARADMGIVLVSAVICLVVIWDSLGGTAGFKIASCILLMIMMNYINIRILRSDMKSLVVGYIKSLDNAEKLEFCSFFNMIKAYDKKSGEAYYDVYKYRVKEIEIENSKDTQEMEQPVSEEQPVSKEQSVSEEQPEKDTETVEEEVNDNVEESDCIVEIEKVEQKKDETVIEIKNTNRNETKNK